jgi:cytochrome c peroxidase
MHDGSTYSLEEVIRLYSEGGENHPAKDPKIRRLNLSEQEQADLVAFLKTLTDWNFVQNKDFLPLTDD